MAARVMLQAYWQPDWWFVIFTDLTVFVPNLIVLGLLWWDAKSMTRANKEELYSLQQYFKVMERRRKRGEK
jgi:hypothetical protein